MPRILIVAPHRPDRSPSQRYRFEQYLPYWGMHGYTFEYASIIDAEDDALLYSQGNIPGKALIFLKSYRKRMAQVRTAAGYDLIFLHREAFMTGSTRFEARLAASGVPLIYDFDDAIWLMDVSDGNRKLRWLKDPDKTKRIIGMADLVIAGNDYLASYAKAYNPRVEMLPTVVDTELYQPVQQERADGKVVIGWTGSHTSMSHLLPAIPMLRSVQDRFGERVSFRIISDRTLEVQGLDIENVRWNSATEATDLAGIDIGIMPLEDSEWSKGKCGFKGLQYMGMGKPAVMQDIGVNRTIIQDGVNGFLASTPEQWSECLSRLVEDADLRRRIGCAARETVVQHYSMIAWRDRYLQLFNELLKRKKNVRTEKDHAHAHP